MLALTVLQAAGRRCVSLVSAKWRWSFLKQRELTQLRCSQQEYAGSHQWGLWLSWLTDWITVTKSVPSVRLDLLLPNSEESASTWRKQITWTPQAERRVHPWKSWQKERITRTYTKIFNINNWLIRLWTELHQNDACKAVLVFLHKMKTIKGMKKAHFRERIPASTRAVFFKLLILSNTSFSLSAVYSLLFLNFKRPFSIICVDFPKNIIGLSANLSSSANPLPKPFNTSFLEEVTPVCLWSPRAVQAVGLQRVNAAPEHPCFAVEMKLES